VELLSKLVPKSQRFRLVIMSVLDASLILALVVTLAKVVMSNTARMVETLTHTTP